MIDPLDTATPIEAVDAELQSLGYTPEDIAAFGRQTRALVRVCVENRAMRAKLERIEELPAKWRTEEDATDPAEVDYGSLRSGYNCADELESALKEPA